MFFIEVITIAIYNIHAVKIMLNIIEMLLIIKGKKLNAINLINVIKLIQNIHMHTI